MQEPEMMGCILTEAYSLYWLPAVYSQPPYLFKWLFPIHPVINSPSVISSHRNFLPLYLELHEASLHHALTVLQYAYLFV
jgi:hypothetical protein